MQHSSAEQVESAGPASPEPPVQAESPEAAAAPRKPATVEDLRKLKSKVSEAKKQRDTLNTRVQELANTIKELKTNRDTVNEQIKTLKVERDKLNEEVSSLIDKIKDLKLNMEGVPQMPAKKMRKDLEKMEFQYETSTISPKKEKEFIKKIEAMRAEVEKREKFEAEHADVLEVSKQIDVKKRDAQKAHNELMKLAALSQQNHEGMIQAVRELEKCKKDANAQHKNFVDFLGQLRMDSAELEATRTGEVAQQVRDERVALKEEAKALAEDLKGKSKFDIRDLQKLLKAGEELPF